MKNPINTKMMNTKINRVRTLIDTRKVHFNNNKQTYTLSPLDVDENSYSYTFVGETFSWVPHVCLPITPSMNEGDIYNIISSL